MAASPQPMGWGQNRVTSTSLRRTGLSPVLLPIKQEGRGRVQDPHGWCTHRPPWGPEGQKNWDQGLIYVENAEICTFLKPVPSSQSRPIAVPQPSLTWPEHPLRQSWSLGWGPQAWFWQADPTL